LTGVALTVSGFACPATALLETALTPAFTEGGAPTKLELSGSIPSNPAHYKEIYYAELSEFATKKNLNAKFFCKKGR
jgi:hypothetical protein